MMSSENSTSGISKAASLTEKSKTGILRFDENHTGSPGKDINSKITALDTDLAQLRVELGTINNSVEEGLDRLGDTDTDLTAKVSETYKRLGEIDNAYRSLIEISSRIDSDIQKLNGDVSAVAEQSASGIKTLEQSTISQSNEFAQKNQQVVTRVNHLLETSKLTGDLLEQKIKATTEKLLQMETHVITEIETLSSVMNDRTDTIGISVESNKAKILKLQSVDEAIIKRATTLEISSAELTVKSQDIQNAVEHLQLSTSKLSNGIGELRDKTRALEDTANNHGSLISNLQGAASDIKARLAVLAERESKHFNMVTAGFLMLLIGTAVIYFSQQNQFDITEARMSETKEIFDNKVLSMQQLQTRSAEMTDESVAALENRVAQMSAVMQKEIKDEIAKVDHKVHDIQDRVMSVDARLTNDLPFSQFGDDSVIHGAHWITTLPVQHYAVQVAYVDDINNMFELAQRYSFYLKNTLSYFEVDNAGSDGKSRYVLLSGNHATQQRAEAERRSLPGYIDMRKPVVQKFADIQQYIVERENDRIN